MVRIFDKNSLSWQTLPGVKLSEYRWYPTQVSQSVHVLTHELHQACTHIAVDGDVCTNRSAAGSRCG